MRLLDPKFRYVPAANTDVTSTWRRFGFRPTTEAERRARRQRAGLLDEALGEVTLAAPARPARSRGKPSLKLA